MFPPQSIDLREVITWVSAASAALARYDGMLRTLHNSAVLLAPLRRKEAVISSRIEGTVTTLDEVLKYEAEEDDNNKNTIYRLETIEALSYANALNHAQQQIENGIPICSRLIKSTHGKLLLFGRGSDKQPGNFKTDQNYIVERERRKVLFIPICPLELNNGIRNLENYINNDTEEPLLKTALSHLEFEALHPFKDGNGRVGRMLITLMLWTSGLISQPHFYISGCLEKYKDEYIDRLRAASSNGLWTEWCVFFLRTIIEQAEENLLQAEQIRNLYDNMKDVFVKTLRSQYGTSALDYMMARPVFKNSHFTKNANIPPQTAARFSRTLVEHNILVTLNEPAGRRSAMYAFEPLLQIVRT